MKMKGYEYPHSGFLSVEKDMNLIVDKMIENDRLKKLLYYTTKDCLNKPQLTEDQTLGLFGKNIRIVPKIIVEENIMNYIIISFDNFVANSNNPEFRDNVIEFDIICNIDQWQLNNFQLRPYKIAAEIDTMFNNSYLSGIGKIKFIGANQLLLKEDLAGLCLLYQTIHGEEDKKHPIVDSEEDIEVNFDNIFNI